MAKFDAVDGALEGFRLVRERPQLLPAWAAFQLAFQLVVGLLGVYLAGEALTEITRPGALAGMDPDEVLASVGAIAPFIVVIVLLQLAATAVFSSAVFRAVLRPQEGGPGYFRLGGDELRVLVSYLGIFVVVFVVAMVVTFILAFVATFTAEASRGLGAFLAAITAVAPLFLFVFVYVRLMLSLPQSFAERRISIVGGWRLSRKRFWPLFGMIVLAAVLTLVVWILALLIYFPLGAVLGGGLKGAGVPLQPSFDSLADWFSPAMGAYLLVAAFATALINAVLVAPLARAYRDLAEAPLEPAAAP
jgi:hypothetical protein